MQNSENYQINENIINKTEKDLQHHLTKKL